MYSIIVSTIKELCLTKKLQSLRISISIKKDNAFQTPKTHPSTLSQTYSSTVVSITPLPSLSSPGSSKSLVSTLNPNYMNLFNTYTNVYREKYCMVPLLRISLPQQYLTNNI